MKIIFCFLLSFALIPLSYACPADSAKSARFALVVHGGAGTMTKQNTPPEKEKAIIASVQAALNTGYEILSRGGSAIDAVEAVIIRLEDDSLFNAGRGSVFNSDGEIEMDASVMDGKTLDAGAAAGLRIVKNPIMAAKRIMSETPHVMLVGRNAEQFAISQHLVTMSPYYFATNSAWRSYLQAKKEDSVQRAKQKKNQGNKNHDGKHGTVGAVALDMNGNLAAGTSTGGMTYKMPGRVGDSPIIGAGTYADNNTCAVSCTGQGEYFIKLGVAKAVSDRIELKQMSLDTAVNEVINKKLADMGGEGGLIAIDKEGNISMSFNTAGMTRGYIKTNGETDIKLYKD